MHIEANKNYILIDNYLQINQIDHDLRELKNIIINGSDLKIINLTPNIIIIKGQIKNINLKDD